MKMNEMDEILKWMALENVFMSQVLPSLSANIKRHLKPKITYQRFDF